MPNSPEELKQLLRYDIDSEKTVGSDKEEFHKDPKCGFYAYEEKNLSQSFDKDLVSDVLLPGHASNGKDSCGKWKICVCKQGDLHQHGGGYFQKNIMHCNSIGCRKCASSTIQRRARSIANRLMVFCSLKKNRKIYLKKNRSRILSHVIVSVPHKEQSPYLTKEGRAKLRAKAIKHLKQLDVDGGVFIDHPYRFSQGLESARLSVHFHFILTGWIDGKIVKESYENTNWLIKQISTIQTWDDCYNLSKYLLSHSAVFMKEVGKRSSEHSIRYFGECYNNKFKVENVFKYSLTGYDQIDSVVYTRKEITKKGIDYPLQNIVYTHSIIQEEIKDIQNTDYDEYDKGKTLAFTKSLKRFVTPPKDNPAIPQSVSPSMEFLQMRFDYGHSSNDIVQSVYVIVVFDPSVDCLCPECSLKMETAVPPDGGWTEQQQKMITDVLKNLQTGETMCFDDLSLFSSLRDSQISNLGMPYFDDDYKLQYDTGVYQRPDCLDSLNPKLYWGIIENIESQKAKYSFKLRNGKCPTVEELQDYMKIHKHSESKNQSLLNFQ
ncbi:MAG: hypothetical protein ACW9XH_06840 [Candidatus Nitrosopumilus sp. bin_32a]